MNVEFANAYRIDTASLEKTKSTQRDVFSKLRAALVQLEIPSHDYLLGGESFTGQLCILYDAPFWAVFSSERGERYNPAFFAEAIDAANYLIWELMHGAKEKFPSHPSISGVFDGVDLSNKKP